ncbi:phosphate acetyltransferase [candidate division KSB1 bacterium]|nr:phosphate acetyltransferase [candidate division KSB1 bacterium]
MELTKVFIEQARKNPLQIVFPESRDERIIIAASKIKEQGIANPVLIGDAEEVNEIASAQKVSLEGIKIISPLSDEAVLDKYAELYVQSRNIKTTIAKKLVKKPLSFGGMMVKAGDADGMVAGVATATASVIQVASLTIGFSEGISTPSSFFMMVLDKFQDERDKIFIFADCAVNIQPDSQQLAEIGIASGLNAKALLGIEPKIAFLSFSTKGSASHTDVDKVREAVRIAREQRPDFNIEGEIQADAAIIPRIAQKKVGESPVAGTANVLIFPDLDAGNIGYKIVQYMANATALGPILQGFAKPVNDMSRGASVDDLIGVTAITVVQAQNLSKK